MRIFLLIVICSFAITACSQPGVEASTGITGRAIVIKGEFKPVMLCADAPWSHPVMCNPSLTAVQIDAILANYGSPAKGHGQDFYDLSVENNIDDAYALAFFMHESSLGTNEGWAGIKSDGTTTHNIGNIICAGYPSCYNRFRDYPTWRDGINDWYQLIKTEYIEQRHTLTVETIIPVYAPDIENDVPAYINSINSLVAKWRNGDV